MCNKVNLDMVRVEENDNEVKRFVGFKGEGVEGADDDMLVGLEVVVVEAEGGGVFVEVAACDFYVEGEFHM
ncbi:hypothetical protein GYH30_049307 [Glycine max]|nr:hypothetical protein GYH30_049307 [Glycine max]